MSKEPTVEELPSIWRQEAEERRAFAKKEMKSHTVEKMHELAAAYQLEVDAVTLEAALKREGWQPIETAPKDGTAILLWEKYCETPLVGYWHNSWRPDAEHYEVSCGMYCQGGTPVGNFPQEHITHWMPLPKPPQESEG